MWVFVIVFYNQRKNLKDQNVIDEKTYARLTIVNASLLIALLYMWRAYVVNGLQDGRPTDRILIDKTYSCSL